MTNHTKVGKQKRPANMPPPAAFPQGGRVQQPAPGTPRSTASRTYRITLAVSRFELDAVKEVASRRGFLMRIATPTGSKPQQSGTGSLVLRQLSLNDIVREFERLKAAGDVT